MYFNKNYNKMFILLKYNNIITKIMVLLKSYTHIRTYCFYKKIIIIIRIF